MHDETTPRAEALPPDALQPNAAAVTPVAPALPPIPPARPVAPQLDAPEKVETATAFAADSAGAVPPPDAPKPRKRRLPVLAVLAALLLVGLAGAVIYVWVAALGPTTTASATGTAAANTPRITDTDTAAAPNATVTVPPTIAPAVVAAPIGPALGLPYGFNVPLGDKTTSPFDSGRFGFVLPDAKGTPGKADPTRLLAQADLELGEGRMTDAEALYRGVAAQGGATLPAATFGVARVLAAEGKSGDAVAAYKDYLQRFPTDGRRRFALFGLAEMSKGLGLWANALDYYGQYLAITDTLAGYVYSDMADCYASLGDNRNATTYYARAFTANASLLVRLTAKEKESDNRLAAGDAVGAIVGYSTILDLAQVPDYRASIAFKRAGAYKVANQGATYTKELRAVIQSYPDTASATKALKALAVVAPTQLDDVDRARLAGANGDWAGAVAALETYLGTSRATPKATTPTVGPTPAPADAPKQADAWLLLARASSNVARPDAAADAYKQVLARYPTLAQAQDAAWALGTLQEDSDSNAAAATFHGLWTGHPDGPHAEDALTEEARLRSVASAPADALPRLASLVAQYDKTYPFGTARAELYTRLANLKIVTNDNAGAQKALQVAAQSPAHDYYAIRAAERLANNGQAYVAPNRSNPLAQPAAYSSDLFAADLPADVTAMETWLGTWATKNGATPDAALARVAADPGLVRLAELHRLGLETAAQREALEAVDRYAKSPLDLYYLALVLSQNGQYYWSVDAARDLYDLSPAPQQGFGSAPRLLRKLLYPLAYQDTVLDQSRQYDVDPLLVLAMIRQESSYNPTAQSWVGARGLTQIMPQTAQGIAGNLKLADFGTDQLDLPVTAIRFGTYYLAARLKDYGGNPAVALAAYNGGAGNADTWSAANPPATNFDTFVSGISYTETRNYVKICLENYARYREIYAVKP